MDSSEPFKPPKRGNPHKKKKMPKLSSIKLSLDGKFVEEEEDYEFFHPE